MDRPGRGPAVRGEVRMPAVFEGLGVLDLTHGFAGALTTMVLADDGATVTRVVAPAASAYRGDPSASSAGAVQWPGGKELLEPALPRPEAVADLLAGVAGADVLVTSSRPGVAARLGFGDDVVAAANPRLVRCAL